MIGNKATQQKYFFNIQKYFFFQRFVLIVNALKTFIPRNLLCQNTFQIKKILYFKYL